MQKNIIRITLITALILLVPLVLTITGSGVDGEGFHWTLIDFVVMGALLFGTGLIYELAVKNIEDSTYRTIVIIVLVSAMLLIWADLVVGIFNIPGISGN